MAKKEYIGMVMTQVETELSQSILEGSVTTKAIKVNNVEVEDYKQGFDIDGNDFQTVSFD